MIPQEDVEIVLEALADDAADYWVDYSIPVLEKCTALEFLREGYSKYHPVILKGLIDDWPAVSNWSEGYLVDLCGEKLISVNLTPDGRADSVQPVYIDGHTEERFVYPAEAQMTMKEFFHHLNRDDCGFIPYLSQQNDNLRVEFPELMADISSSFAIADEAFGNAQIEAVNLWIGDERSVSSTHKDHFENLYAVISGAKTFTLFPPTDVAALPFKTYKTARYVASKVYDSSLEQPGENYGTYQLDLTTEGCPSSSLEWVPIDPNDRAEAIQRYPRFRNSRPLQCTVYPGEVLYLPALWYHRVSQSMPTIAVNFWYDMRFDFR